MTNTPKKEMPELPAARRQLLRDLIRENFAGQNDQAAWAIEKISGRRVSRRSIQTWLSDPTLPSSRNCPPWALEALQRCVSDPENKQRVPRPPSAFSPDPFERFAEFADKRSVEVTGAQIEYDQRLRKTWESASFTDWPRMVFELQRSHEKRLALHYRWINGLFEAIRDSDDHSSLRKLAARHLDAPLMEEHEISEIRTAREQKKDEFSNDEGLPVSDPHRPL